MASDRSDTWSRCRITTIAAPIPRTPSQCVDTAAAGPVLLGPGGGFMYELGRHFALTLGASALVGVSAFTFHLDVGGGIAVKL